MWPDQPDCSDWTEALRVGSLPYGTPRESTTQDQPNVEQHEHKCVGEARRGRNASASAVRRDPNHVPAGGLFPFDLPVPLFIPPTGFQLRLGASPTDEFLSGTFPVGNQNVGFIRIPSFVPFNEAPVLDALAEACAAKWLACSPRASRLRASSLRPCLTYPALATQKYHGRTETLFAECLT